MGKYQVKFELVSTAYAYIEADSPEQAEDVAMELFGCDCGFVDELLGTVEGETCDIVAVDEIDLDSVAYRVIDCYKMEKSRWMRL